MDDQKKQYLSELRSNTAYPTYRGIIGVITLLLFILAGIQALMALLGGLAAIFGGQFIAGLGALLIGGIVAVLTFVFAKFWQEAATMFADIGDSVTDANARKK